MKLPELNRLYYSFILLFLFFYSSNLKSQVTIGTLDPPHESAVLELKSDNNNMGFLATRIALSDIFDTSTIASPATGLLVYNTKNSDVNDVPVVQHQVKADKFYYWGGDQWIEIISMTEVRRNIELSLSELGASRPALYTLNAKDSLMNGNNPTAKPFRNMLGLATPLLSNTIADLPMTETINYTSGMVSMTLNTDKATELTFKPGVYRIIFAYEFVPTRYMKSSTPTDPGCTSSAYYVDFPRNEMRDDGTYDTSLTTRVISSNTHKAQTLCDHGSEIHCTIYIYQETKWRVRIGAYNSCDCISGKGKAMPNRSNFVYISRVGEIDAIK